MSKLSFMSGLGSFLQSAGSTGMNISQAIDERKQREAEAAARKPYEKLQLDKMSKALEMEDLNLQQKRMDIQKRTQDEADLKQFQKLMTKPVISKYLERQIDAVLSEKSGKTYEATQERAPTTQEQLERIKGTGYEFSTNPAIRQSVSGLKQEYAAQQEPILEQQKFEREQSGKIELQKMRGEQSKEIQILKNNQKKEIELWKKEESQKSPVFKKLGAADKEKFYLINKNRDLLVPVMEQVSNLEPGRLQGFLRAVQNPEKQGKWITTPELQKLYSRYTWLYQNILKQTQGSRPSDYDAQVFELATGKRAVNKENMMSALGALDEFLTNDTKSFIDIVSKGYGIDKNEVLDILSSNVKSVYEKPEINEDESIEYLRKKYNY